jgi:hypothetical protein
MVVKSQTRTKELNKKQKTEKEKLLKIRKAAIEEVKKLKKEGKSITTNAVEVVCREEDIFHTKSK